MADRLTAKKRVKSKDTYLDTRKSIKFKVAITDKLDNNYCFKTLNSNHIKSFHRFLNDTVNKGLSISQVDDLYKRKKGPKEEIKIKGSKFELIHLGKDLKSFRIFGYYNPDNYFVVTKIDPKHKTHK